MRLKATVETLNRDVSMKTKPAYSLISLGKKPPAMDNFNDDPKVSTVKDITFFFFVRN